MQDLGAVIAQLDSSRAGHYWLDPTDTSQTLQGVIQELKSIIGGVTLGPLPDRKKLLQQAHVLALQVKVAERLHQQSILLREARYDDFAERAGIVIGSQYGPGSTMRFDTHRLVAEG